MCVDLYRQTDRQGRQAGKQEAYSAISFFSQTESKDTDHKDGLQSGVFLNAGC